eukprot:12299414-Prorocentrum_lima.AAC.1
MESRFGGDFTIKFEDDTRQTVTVTPSSGISQTTLIANFKTKLGHCPAIRIGELSAPRKIE